MKTFDIEEAKKMSNNELMAIVCDGLAEVAESLANRESSSRIQERRFIEQSSHFRAFSRMYKAKAANEKIIGEKAS